MSLTRGGIESSKQFCLNVFGQSPAFTASSHHLVSDLLIGSLDEMIRSQMKLRKKTRKWLFTEFRLLADNHGSAKGNSD